MIQFRHEQRPVDDTFLAYLGEQAAQGWHVVTMALLGGVQAKASAVVVPGQNVQAVVPLMYVLFRRDEPTRTDLTVN